MASLSELWSRGRRKWSLSHEGENGPKGLSVAGDVPDTLAAIRKDMEDLQLAHGGDDTNIDYIFEIPLKVAQSLVGFKHDEVRHHLIGGRFNVMSIAGPKSGILNRLFSRR